MTQPFFKRYRFPLVGGSILLLVVGVASYLTSVADLRPGTKRGPISEESAARGRQLLDEMERAHGGADRWRALRTARFTVSDEWSGPAALASPWPANPGRFDLAMLLGSDTGRLEIEGGPTWGVQHWMTYSVDPSGQVQWDAERNFDRWFWVPTVAYFLEAPYRLGEATVVADVGPATHEGVEYDRVFLTWGNARPSRRTDQYVVWIDRKTRRLARLEYTLRDYAGFIQSAMDYSDYREVAGFPIAHRIAGDHAMTIEKVELGADVPDSVLLPDPSRRGAK